MESTARFFARFMGIHHFFCLQVVPPPAPRDSLAVPFQMKGSR